ncbi:hypothetical protein ACEN88_35700, partial [Massilia sp. CT11-108]|uniref:hypothetical protein n=1 Tax=Massilia sp. CT11-108 TaxID=3393900 RepID=UPI0039A726DF
MVLPSNNSPFGPLTSSLSGDEILIDGMPSGNFFGFFWNSKSAKPRHSHELTTSDCIILVPVCRIPPHLC